jgi:hypothetical protein
MNLFCAPFPSTTRKSALLATLAAAGILGAMAPVSFAGSVDISGVLPVAVDQPQINAIITNPSSGSVLTTSGGYSVIQAYLDTGTSSIVLANSTWNSLGISPATVNGQNVVFNDVAIGGTTPFYVSSSGYDISTAPFSVNTDQTIGGTPPPLSSFGNTVGPANLELTEQPNPLSSLTGATDIMGMPVMYGKVTVLDIGPANNFANVNNPGETQTYIYAPGTPFNPSTLNTNPGIVPTTYQVGLSYASFQQFTSVSPTGATGATYAPNPFIGANPVMAFNGQTQTNAPPGVTIAFNNASATGSFLLDTGAQSSFISQAMAAKLGVEYEAGTYGTSSPVLVYAATGKVVPDQFTIPLGGAGGSSITAAGFYLSSLSLQTKQGTTITFQNAPVEVLDVTVTDPATGKSLTLDGDLGMNFFEPSATVDLGTVNAAAFNWMTIDQPDSQLGLIMAGDNPVPEPAALSLLLVGAPILLARRSRRHR